MGLDIYLYKSNSTIEEIEAYEAQKEKASNAFCEKLDKKYNTVGENTKRSDEYWGEFREWEKLYGTEYPEPQDELIEFDSKIDPKHYFKVGYCRSSYNNGGINHVLYNAIGENLYTIFFGEDDNNDYLVKPDWAAVRQRALSAHESYSNFLNKTGDIRVMDIHNNVFVNRSELPTSPKAVMDIFVKQQTQHDEYFAQNADTDWKKRDLDWYSNRDGEFFLGKGIEILAAIPGINSTFKCDSVYLIYREKRTDKNWYLTALDILVETCDYVLSQPDSQKYCVRWSS